MFKPMLAHEYEKSQKHVTWPAYCQPKLDGIRGCVTPEGVFSRNGKRIKGMPRLTSFLVEHCEGRRLDGEFFSRMLSFQQIASSVRRTKNIKEDEKVQFWIYDANLSRSFKVRNEVVNDACACYRCAGELGDRIMSTPTACVSSETQFLSFYDVYLSEGFEGIMYRDGKTLYEEGKRSRSLLKLKPRLEGRAIVRGFVQGKGKHKDRLGTLECWDMELDKGFEVGTGFTDAQREAIWENQSEYLRLRIVYLYQELTDRGVPRFPVFKKWS